jgi:hypothetical protein
MIASSVQRGFSATSGEMLELRKQQQMAMDNAVPNRGIGFSSLNGPVGFPARQPSC